MLNKNEIRYAVEMQHRCYSLLKWMAKAVEDGFIEFETAHHYSSLPEATEAWILRHYLNIPVDARVDRADLGDFCNFFSTYLENSFDLIPNPGKQRYSPHAHCFCPMCSWLINAPNLKTKKLTSADKKRASKLKADAIRELAAEHQVTLTEQAVEEIVDDTRLRESLSLVAYGHDLLRRLKGIATGPAVLALWRGFAWTETGSPKQGFRLSADAILQAEEKLRDAVFAYEKSSH